MGIAEFTQQARWSIFVAFGCCIRDDEYWWQEVLLWALRAGEITDAGLRDCLRPEDSYQDNGCRNVLLMIESFAKLGPKIRSGNSVTLLEDRLRSLGVSRHMLTLAELAKLRQSGVAICGHGATHLPLSQIDDPDDDLRRSTEWLRGVGGLPAMSCPHRTIRGQAYAGRRSRAGIFGGFHQRSRAHALSRGLAPEQLHRPNLDRSSESEQSAWNSSGGSPCCVALSGTHQRERARVSRETESLCDQGPVRCRFFACS